jgi:hypothetical protein
VPRPAPGVRRRREQLRRRWRLRRWRVLARSARDARRRLRPLRERDAGAVPSDRRSPGLLLRLLPDDARLVLAPHSKPMRAAPSGAARFHCALGRPPAASAYPSYDGLARANSADNLRSHHP